MAGLGKYPAIFGRSSREASGERIKDQDKVSQF
jgi:hypothetical protein